MKAFLLLVMLLLLVPMIVLNPLGRPAFLGYYAGVIATWAVFAIVIPLGQSLMARAPLPKLSRN